jgi:UDP-2,3-diacylglucosamine pyrophosphatase LpxH
LGDTQVHLISLDSMLSVQHGFVAAMVEWLQADLKDAAQTVGIRFAVAFFHHAPFSKGHHDSDEETEMVRVVCRTHQLSGASSLRSGNECWTDKQTNRQTDKQTNRQTMREAVVPVLEAGGVDLIISGHSHESTPNAPESTPCGRKFRRQ